VPAAFRALLGNHSLTASGNSIILNISPAFVGELVVVRLACDNLSASTPTITSVVSSPANTWTQVAFRGQNATANAGVIGAVWVSKLTADMPNGSPITFTFSANTTHRCLYAAAFTGVEATLRNAAVVDSGSGTASTVTSGNALAGDLVIGAVAIESRTAPTYDTDTTNGSWAGNFVKPAVASGSDTSTVEIAGQYKIVTADGPQTFNLTNANTDWAAMVAVFQATPGVPPNQGSATVDHSWALAATGAQPVPPNLGSATVDWTETSAAVGKETPKGAAVTTWTATSVAVGKRTPEASASTTWTETTAATGKKILTGSVNITFTETLSAVGRKTPTAVAAVGHSWGTSGVGRQTPKGSVTVGVSWTLSAAGIHTPAFSPDSIAGLSVWFDAADVGPITTQWPSKTGANHGAVLGSPAPVVVPNALSGKSVVRFTVSEGRVRVTGSGVTKDYTVAYVGRIAGPTPGRVLCAAYPSGGNLLFGFWTTYMDVAYATGGAGFFTPDTRQPWMNAWKLYSGDCATPAVAPRFFSDGALLGQHPTPPATDGFGGTLNLSGYGATGTEESCDCEVAEVLLYDRQLSDAERQQVEGYLRAKWLSAPPPSIGTAAVFWSAATAAVGKRVPEGTAVTTTTWTTSAVGRRVQRGSAVTTWTETSAAVGKRVPKANAATTYTETTSASGKRVPKATATVVDSWTLTAQGIRPVVGVNKGTALVSHSWVTSAVGKRVPKGSNTFFISWVTTAVGAKQLRGAAEVTAVWTTSAVGKTVPKSTAAVNHVWTVDAAGLIVPQATAVVSYEFVVLAEGTAGVLGYIEGMWKGEIFDAMQYGDQQVVDWLLTPPLDIVDV
jgi:hypothetical protein